MGRSCRVTAAKYRSHSGDAYWQLSGRAGGRTILGPISKRGNRYLRMLFVQAARSVLLRPKSWQKYGLKSWIEAAARRLNRFKLAIALANKIARVAWGVLNGGRNFEVRSMRTAPQAG